MSIRQLSLVDCIVQSNSTQEVTYMRNVAMVFLVLGVAFIAIGLSGQRTFIYVGIAFLAVALLRFLPRRR
jgi:hypothetical protein